MLVLNSDVEVRLHPLDLALVTTTIREIRADRGGAEQEHCGRFRRADNPAALMLALAVLVLAQNRGRQKG
jgi:hypothetical protein